MEFTFQFIKLFLYGLGLAAPLLISLVLLIMLLGQIVGIKKARLAQRVDLHLALGENSGAGAPQPLPGASDAVVTAMNDALSQFSRDIASKLEARL
jgi:hypothetical protein